MIWDHLLSVDAVERALLSARRDQSQSAEMRLRAQDAVARSRKLRERLRSERESHGTPHAGGDELGSLGTSAPTPE
jgi:hypothetical protein